MGTWRSLCLRMDLQRKPQIRCFLWILGVWTWEAAIERVWMAQVRTTWLNAVLESHRVRL